MLNTILAQETTLVDLAIEEAPTWGVTELISWAVTLVLVIAGLIFFFMLLIGGIKWIISGGDKAQTESARNQITAALIGLIIVFAAWALARLLDTVFGIDILNFNIPVVGEAAG